MVRGSKKYPLFLYVLILPILLTEAMAQPALRTENSSFACVGDYLHHVSTGVKNSFDDPEWLIGAGTIALLSNFDKQVQEQYTGKLLPRPLSKIGRYYGYGINYALASCFVVGESLLTDRHGDDVRSNLQTLSESVAVSVGITYALKYTTHRLRPNGQDCLSFPSGHASSSFAVAASLNHMYGKRIGVPAYALAVLTGVSRINDNKHWLSDVLSGALLGTLVGRGFSALINDDNNSHATNTPRFNVQFSIVLF